MKVQALHIVLLSFFLFPFRSISQITTTNAAPYNTPDYLVTDVLLGSGMTASNFSWQSAPDNIGYFDGTNANVGFENGVLLCTGGVDFVTGGFGGGAPNIAGDADLGQLLSEMGMGGFNINNVTLLEFDFVAQSESMTFNYVFGSAEYTSYTCSSFNDVFGFFVSGPGINGSYSDNAVNIALVPGTNTPVAINTINAGELTNDPDCNNIDPDFESYNVYWVDNDYGGWGGGPQGPNTPPDPENTVSGFTGFTVPLEAFITGLICDETYHIKLAIGNCLDTALDSGVFLEANSFASPAIEVTSFNSEADISGSSVLEGCGDLNLQFIRSGDMTMDLVVDLSYSGDAIMGLDYENLPDQITLPANQEEYVLPIAVFYDGIGEGTESLIITIDGLPVACSDLETQTIELSIIDQDELIVDAPEEIDTDCFGEVEIAANVSGGIEPYVYSWFDENGSLIGNESSIIQDPDFSTSFSVEVTDSCQNQIVSATTNVEVLPAEVDASLPSDIILCEGESISITPTIDGGLDPYFYVWYLNGSIVSTDLNLEFENAPEGLYQFIVQEGCGGMAADELTVSYITPSPYVELSSSDVPNPALLPEGCFQSNLDFNLLEPNSEDFVVDFTTGGTATFGEDYNLETFQVTIPAGETTVSIPIEIIADDVFEGDEQIEFYFNFIDECSDWPEQLNVTIYELGNLYASAPEELIVCEDELDQYAIPGIVGGGIGLVNFGWYYQGELISTEINLPVEDLSPGQYTLIASDQCDNIVEANVDLEFTLLSPIVDIISESYTDPLVMTEACGYSTLLFQMPYAYTNDIILYYETSGTFTNGGDVFNLPGYVEVPAGVTSVAVDIIPISDNIEEENETIIFSFPFVNECVDQSDIEITINNVEPIILSVPNGSTVCSGQEVILEGYYSGGVEPMTYFWTTPDGDVSTLNLTTYPEDDWEYTFNVVDACGYEASASVFIQTEDYEPMEILWPPQNVNACVGEQDMIIPDVSGGAGILTYNWYVNGVLGGDTLLVGSDIPNMYIPTDNPDYFEYEMTVTDDCNNTLSYFFNVNVVDCASPNVFTPNGDGNNDYFALDFGTLSDGARMEIFNRWGELVFKSENYAPCDHSNSSCWDGTYFNLGEVCPDGVYFYKLKYNNETTQKVGYVLLTR